MATTAGTSVPSYGISPLSETGTSSSEPCIVEEWLKTLNLVQYAESFVDNGYDDLEICKQIGEPDLDAIGVADPSHRQIILRAVRLLLEHGATAVYFTLEECQSSQREPPPRQREDCHLRDSTCLDGAKLDLEGADNYACEFGINSGGESPPTGGGATGATLGGFGANSFSRINRKYNDEYEEGKAELVRFPKLQLKVFLREKLIRDGIRLGSFPYTNADGSRGHLETLAVRYAHELRTHYQDVLERLEEVRRRRVAIDVVPVEENYGSIKALYKPGKYSPSSCLSDHEEETIYDNNYCAAIYRANTTASTATINNCKSTNIVASSPHTQRCVSPKSKLLYEPCPTEVRENGENLGEHSKKHRSGVTSGVLSGVGGGGLGKLFRSLGSKKDKTLSPKHKGSSSQISKASNYGFTLKLGGGHHHTTAPGDANVRGYQHAEISEPLVGDEERVQLLRMVRDGYLTMEEAVQKIRNRQAELAKERKYPEVIAELTRGGLWGPGGRKTQPKPSSIFYPDQINIPRLDSSLVEEGHHDVASHHAASSAAALGGGGGGHNEPSELLERLSLRHHSPNPPLQKLPHYSSATLGTPRRNAGALERGTPPRTFTQEEFAATILARTQVTLGQRLSSSGETREPCSGECGNIMCSLSAATEEECVVDRTTPLDGDSTVAETMTENGTALSGYRQDSPPGLGERSLSVLSAGEEGLLTNVNSQQQQHQDTSCNSNNSLDGNNSTDYVTSSTVMERRSKSGVLGKFRSLTNRSSYSTSEEGHSQSSDCEDLDESRFSPRDSNNRASTTSFAGKVRDLHRDVKRRFGKLRGSTRSGDNENNGENGEAPIEGGSSMESIPSGSGGSRSSLQAHTPTSSNRSSSSAGEDETASVIGPILGRARALVDVTPSPYDRDALGLKKGDIIDIIAKNNTGTWVGVVKGKVGHFKFINVEEIAVESRARRRRRKERFNPSIRGDNHVPNSNSEGYQDAVASPTNERWQPETLEQLLNHFGLQGCMNVLMLHGYEDLNTFREIERDDLSSLGITSPSLQKRLLRAAEALYDDDEIDEVDEGTNLENEDLSLENGNNRQHSDGCNEAVLSTNNLDTVDTGFVLTNFSSSSRGHVDDDDESLNQDVNEENHSEVPHSPRLSDFRPNIPASEPSNERLTSDENGSVSSTIAFTSSSQQEDFVSTDSGQGDSGESVRSNLRTTANMLKASSICSVSGYDSEGSLSYSVRMEDFDFGRPDARLEVKNSKGKVPPPIPKRTTPTVVRPSKFPNGTVEVNCNGDAMVSYLYQDHDGYGIMVDSRSAKGVKSATLPRKKLMDGTETNQQHVTVEKPEHHHGGSRLLEKKLYKKFGQRKGSLQTQALKSPRPPSLSLLTAVYRKLEDEGIDLGQEPYTDKTGFCGIPPALVQRYAEELQRDIYDVAESMDQARINSLQMRGRRGVPNDFLADACYGPVVEANYSGSLREWLISLGLPMYEEHFRLACLNRGLGHPLEKVALLRDSDLRNFGIRNARHVRLLTTAIGALNIHLGRLGGLC